MIIPSIDIMNGKVVQLINGKKKVLEVDDPVTLAADFRKYGEIAVIDLDAAMGKGSNLELIKKICKIADCRVGGGIRTKKQVMELLAAGARKVIIGTAATKEFLSQLPKQRVIVALDNIDGEVVDKAWTRKTGRDVTQQVKELEPYCSEFLVTFVEKEGMMQGTNLEMVEKLKNKTRIKLTIAGGVSSPKEVAKLEALGCNSQLGMAVYTEKISLSDCFVSSIDFKKGLIPTIVQDSSSRVLMLAYSSSESLSLTFKTGKPTYFSRSRNKIWVKGETSGNTQDLITVRFDCDNDALLFTVYQKNVACHTGSYSCFSDKTFTLSDLYEIIEDRKKNPVGSYTSNLVKDERKIKEKIIEEAGEVVFYKDRQNLVEELADLFYFMNALMVNKEVSMKEVLSELEVRSNANN